VEGFRHTSKPIFSVQYHPEASPARMTRLSVQQFLESMERK
jgi:carbamoylphosphate synthase small subunit